MAGAKLIAESGATKAEWCVVGSGKKKSVITQGISPYFFTEQKIVDLLNKDLLPAIKPSPAIDEIHYYGTGMLNPHNVKMIKNYFRQGFPKATIEINDDML